MDKVYTSIVLAAKSVLRKNHSTLKNPADVDAITHNVATTVIMEYVESSKAVSSWQALIARITQGEVSKYLAEISKADVDCSDLGRLVGDGQIRYDPVESINYAHSLEVCTSRVTRMLNTIDLVHRDRFFILVTRHLRHGKLTTERVPVFLENKLLFYVGWLRQIISKLQDSINA